MLNSVIKLAAIALAGTALAAPAAVAQVKLPPTITMTAYDTGTSGFNIAVADRQDAEGQIRLDTRVLPAGNDVARLQPLRADRASSRPWASASTSRRKACSNSRPGNGDRSRSRSR